MPITPSRTTLIKHQVIYIIPVSNRKPRSKIVRDRKLGARELRVEPTKSSENSTRVESGATTLSRYPRVAPPSMINRPRNGNYNVRTNDCEHRVTIRLPVARAISHRGAIPPPASYDAFPSGWTRGPIARSPHPPRLLEV